MPVRWSMGLPDHRLQGFEPPRSVRGFAPKPGVALGSAQPRAVWHDAVGVGEGNREWTRMDANGWGRGLCDLGEKSEWEQNLAQNGGGAERRDSGSLRLGVSARYIFRWGLCCECVLFGFPQRGDRPFRFGSLRPRPGTPKRVLPQSPGLRRRRRYPGCRREIRDNPGAGCADGPNGWLALFRVGCEMENVVWCFPLSRMGYLPGWPFGTNLPRVGRRHNPIRGRECNVAWTRGSAATRTTPGCMA